MRRVKLAALTAIASTVVTLGCCRGYKRTCDHHWRTAVQRLQTVLWTDMLSIGAPSDGLGLPMHMAGQHRQALCMLGCKSTPCSE